MCVCVCVCVFIHKYLSTKCVFDTPVYSDPVLGAS